ncbi:glycosyltransferase [Pedobacter sp. SYP-B3415]|uniref:glycosyltransferase n=1 Tax=Pedobacter sp. SYP-B3415 TaxID=2496641 RepID=UPI00101CBC93|nr:glycosyltransferase [Pedobacter sp. SYP-B3415]
MRTKELKVLHVSYSLDVGGASVAMLRIHEALLAANVDSKILVCVGSSDRNAVMVLKTGWAAGIHKFMVRCLGVLWRCLQPTKHRTTRSVNFISSGMAKKINSLEVDVVHFHWIGNETIAIEEISQINRNIVWTMHDLWPVLGAEHNNVSGSERFLMEYSRHRDTGYSGLDIEKQTWLRKKKYWQKVLIAPVAVSNWQQKLVSRSYLFKRTKVRTISNPIDQDKWMPYNKTSSRIELGLSRNKQIILFGAYNFLVDPIKGFNHFKNVISKMPMDKYQVVLFGSDVPVHIKGLDIKNLGKIDNTEKLRKIYSAADVYVMSSLQETFGQAAVESICCETPVVAFAGSGLDDIIDHLNTGYLAIPYDENDLLAGINSILDHSWKNKTIREGVIAKFNSQTIANKYIDAYKEISG